MRKSLIIIGGVVAVVIVGTAAASGGSDKAPTTVAKPTASATSAAPEKATVAPKAEEPTAKLPLQDGDWRLDTLQLKSESYGNDFTGRARITYTGTDPDGGDNLFTVTVFRKGVVVGALDGSASSVKPGGTVTVDLFCTDKFVKGPYTYDFQNNF